MARVAWPRTRASALRFHACVHLSEVPTVEWTAFAQRVSPAAVTPQMRARAISSISGRPTTVVSSRFSSGCREFSALACPSLRASSYRQMSCQGGGMGPSALSACRSSWRYGRLYLWPPVLGGMRELPAPASAAVQSQSSPPHPPPPHRFIIVLYSRGLSGPRQRFVSCGRVGRGALADASVRILGLQEARAPKQELRESSYCFALSARCHLGGP